MPDLPIDPSTDLPTHLHICMPTYPRRRRRRTIRMRATRSRGKREETDGGGRGGERGGVGNV
eukprot:1635664-Pyramimonas_sp.AAC.1